MAGQSQRESSTRVVLRPFTNEDLPAVLDLVRADLLPGQPTPTLDVLQRAVEGCPAGLEDLRTDVLVSAKSQVVGVLSYAIRAEDETGVLLWLHCLEDEQSLAEHLVQHTLVQLGRRTVHGFTFPFPAPLAPSGLPMRGRIGTRRALEAYGFSSCGQGHYLHRRLDGTRSRYAITDLTPCLDGMSWQLRLRERDGTRIGEARIVPLDESIALLQWIMLSPDTQHGALLLEQSLGSLADRGIREITTLLGAPTDDQPHHEGTLRLHQEAGFTEVDQLEAYIRRP